MSWRPFRRRQVSCQEWVEIVTAYLDGALPRRIQRSIDRHLEECPPCDEYLAQMRRTIELVGRVGDDDDPPQELVDRLSAVFEEHRGR